VRRARKQNLRAFPQSRFHVRRGENVSSPDFSPRTSIVRKEAPFVEPFRMLQRAQEAVLRNVFRRFNGAEQPVSEAKYSIAVASVQNQKGLFVAAIRAL
jgi:hypothetical protein